MPEGLQSITQADFSGGAWPGLEDVPLNGVEDIVDGFLRDDGAIERRGGTAYKSNANHFPSSSYAATYIWDGYLSVGRRTLVIGSFIGGGQGHASLLDPADDATPIALGSVWNVNPSARAVEIAGMVLRPAGGTAGTQDDVTGYAGAISTFAITAGTITVTQGSRTVTGVGTAFSSTHAGGMLRVTSGFPGYEQWAAVKSVQSATSLTLAEEWPYPTKAATTYGIDAIASITFITSDGLFEVLEDSPSIPSPNAYFASVDGRLVVAQGNKISMSGFIEDSAGVSRSAPLLFNKDDYHLLPEGVIVVGMQSFGGNLLIFTTGGVWSLTNLAYDLTDDLGNPQQRVEAVNQDVLLWGDVGISTWNNQLVVPALDDLYLFGEGTQPITGGARKLYREYVKAGYRIGQGAMYRGHYLLPILPNSEGGAAVDVLVWRLDARNALARWAGHAKSRAFTVRTTDPSRSPKLLGADDRRVLDMTDCFEPSTSVKSDANGTAHQLKVTSRSIMLSETIDHTLRFGRLRYELDDAASDNPTFTAEWSRGRPGSSFTALTGSASEGEDTFTWSLAKAGQQTRMRFTSNNAASKAVVRAMEFKVRQHGSA